MRILLTGATGFLGGHAVPALLGAGHEVVALGRDPHRLAALGVEAVRADLRDREALAAACRGCAAVVHSAALSAPWGRRRDFLDSNVRGTENVVAACERHGARLVHVSSPAVVFADRDLVDSTEDAPYPRSYSSLYAWSKRLAEERVHAANVPWVVLRPKAIFGPGDTSLVPRLVAAARAGRLPVIGDGTNRVDLTYVSNVADALTLAAESPLTGRTFTITNGEHVPLWPLVALLLAHFGLPAPTRRVPLWLARAVARLSEWRAALLGGEPALTRYTAAVLGTTQTYDVTAARRDLGYQPRVSVEEGVRRTLEAMPC